MEPEIIQIKDDAKIIDVKCARIDRSTFESICAIGLNIKDANLSSLKITDANLSDLEIEGAQLGGAYIHNIGMPPKGHPLYSPSVKQRPLKFENCDLNNSIITNCNLSGVYIDNCNIEGMKIFGVLVEDLFKEYQKINK